MVVITFLALSLTLGVIIIPMLRADALVLVEVNTELQLSSHINMTNTILEASMLLLGLVKVRLELLLNPIVIYIAQVFIGNQIAYLLLKV